MTLTNRKAVHSKVKGHGILSIALDYDKTLHLHFEQRVWLLPGGLLGIWWATTLSKFYILAPLCA